MVKKNEMEILDYPHVRYKLVTEVEEKIIVIVICQTYVYVHPYKNVIKI